jgi:nitrogenase subunit NifH
MDQMGVNYQLYKKSDEIYFVISSSLSNVSIAKDYELKALQGKIVKYILNRYNAKKEESIINKIEQVLGKQLTLLIPKNIVAISTAQSSCSTIKEVGENLDISQMYVKLAKSVVGKK